MTSPLLTASSRKNHVADGALLLLLTLACYWPFTFSIFSAKNDNIIAVLPLRYNISEAIRSGHFPFWSPYIYMGFPMHSDMQSGCWNPFVWLFSLMGRYNLTMLHAEILLYIFIAGTGMQRLLKRLNVSRQVCLIGAAAYIMSGFVTDVGGSNILFLAAASFIPFVLNYYLQFLRDATLKNAVKTSLALCLLFLTSYPSFFILTCYVMLAALIVTALRSYKRTGIVVTKRFALNHFLMIVFFAAICAPAIISYWDLLPYYRRGTSVSLEMSQQNNFHPASLISLLFPTASLKDDGISTDLICRNIYFNSIILIFLISIFWLKKNALHYFAIIGLVFFLLFSFGEFTPVHKISYKILPLLNTFRHPANARLFVIIAAIVLGCIALNEPQDERRTKAIKWISLSLLVVCFGYFIYGIVNSNLFSKINLPSANHFNRETFKNFLHSLTFEDAIVINSFLQLIFFGGIVWMLVRRNQMLNSPRIFILNSFLFAQLAIPFTFASQQGPGKLNGIIADCPKGFPLPNLNTTIAENSFQTQQSYEKFGLLCFYNKQFGLPDRQVTPTFMSSYNNLLANDSVRKIALHNSIAFLADTMIFWYSTRLEEGILDTHKMDSAKKGNLRITNFSSNSFEFDVETDHRTALCLQQVLLPGWKAYYDGKQTFIHRGNTAFMFVYVLPGKHHIKFEYWPRHIIHALILSIIALLTALVLLKRKNK